MIVGIAILAIQTYIFLRLVNSNLDDYQYGEFSALWSLTMGVVLGFTFPLEAFGLALKNRNLSTKEQLSLEIVTFQKIILSLATLIFLGSIFFINLAFNGNWIYFFQLMVLSISYAFIFISRSRLIKNHDYKKFAFLINFDGCLRIIFALVAYEFKFSSGATTSLAVTLSGFVTAVLGLILTKTKIKNFFSRIKFNKTNIHSLVIASLASYLILNIGPFVIQISEPNSGLAGLELNSLTIARSPIFIGPVIQSILISNIQSTVKVNHENLAVHLIFKALMFSGLIYLFGALIFSTWGKELVEFLFGRGSTSRQTNFSILAFTTFFCLLTITAQSFFVATNKLLIVRNAWTISIVLLVLVLLLPIEENVKRTELASLVAFLGSFIYLLYSIKPKLLSFSR